MIYISQLQDSEQYTREVKLVLAAVCIMNGIEPVKGDTETPDAPSFEEYMEPAESLLQEPMVFLESLYSYDKVDLTDIIQVHGIVAIPLIMLYIKGHRDDVALNRPLIKQSDPSDIVKPINISMYCCLF